MKCIAKLGCIPLFVVVVSCGESTATTPVLEQKVFAALGGLRPGESLTLTGPDARELLLGGHGLPGEYVVVPFHSSSAGNARLQVQITGTGLSQPPSTAVSPISDHSPLMESEPTWDLHEEMHARRTDQAERHLSGLRRSNSLHLLDLNAVGSSLRDDNAFVGQLVPLNADASGPACSGLNMRTGRVEAISDHSIIVADTTNPAGGFTSADYAHFAAEFDRLIHPTVTRHFGEPTDIDGNQRSIVFFTRAVNEITQPGMDGYVSGFFWVRDLIPTAANCPASNEAEIFFMLVPDPNRQASHLAHTRAGVLASTLPTIGHEYQHLINAGRRLASCPAGCFEEVWLDEGLSHIAEELLFYTESGRTSGSNLSRSNTTQVEQNLTSVFMGQNLIRYGRYLQTVTAESPIGGGELGSLGMRGAIWAFLRYAADHANRSDEEFFRSLVFTTRTGMDNLNNALEGAALEWLRTWGVAVYADDLGISSEPRYGQPSWDYRSWLSPLFIGGFPLRVHPLAPGGAVDLNIRAGTSGYVRLRGAPGEVSRVATTSGGVAPPSQLDLTVLRTQ